MNLDSQSPHLLPGEVIHELELVYIISIEPCVWNVVKEGVAVVGIRRSNPIVLIAIPCVAQCVAVVAGNGASYWDWTLGICAGACRSVANIPVQDFDSNRCAVSGGNGGVHGEDPVCKGRGEESRRGENDC